MTPSTSSRLASAGRVGVKGLEDALRRGRMPSRATTTARSLREQRAEALRETWRYARAQSAFHAQRLPALAPREIELSSLLDVEPTTAAVLQSDPVAPRCLSGLPGYVIFTGGTSGHSRIRYGSETELERRSTAGTSRTAGLRRLGLISGGGEGGIVPQMPSQFDALSVPFRSRPNYEWVKQLLLDEHAFEGYEPRVTRMMLSLPTIKKLLLFLLEQDVAPSQLAVRSIVTFSWYLSTGWRAAFAEYFGAEVIDLYGFSEVPAHATECATCGLYHYGPDVVWEVVGRNPAEPVSEGIGRLLVTSLLPYFDDYVLFRYAPGDLVELGDFCPAADDRGFRAVGRESHAVAVDHDGVEEWVLLPVDVQECIDRWPWVARAAGACVGITASNDDAPPKWRAVSEPASGGRTRIALEVELKWSPALFAAESRKLAEQLKQTLLRRRSALRRLHAQGLVDLQVRMLAPGSLSGSDVYEV